MTDSRSPLPSTPPQLNALHPGRHRVGDCLYLEVDEPRDGHSARRWLLRMRVQGRRMDIGLGSYPLVGVKAAREKASKYRLIAREGGNPLSSRQKHELCPTFAEAAKRLHELSMPRWKNLKHAQQWITTLERFVFPSIGSKKLSDITTKDILDLLEPIWLRKEETARRVYQRLSAVLEWAQASGFCQTNAASGVKRALPSQRQRQAHHRALPYPGLPAFVRRLRESRCSHITRAALEFLILTATRTNEVLGMRWDEIDGNVWVLPQERSKSGRALRVPLGKRAVSILDEASSWASLGGYVFPGRSPGLPLSNMTFLMAMERLGFRSKAVPHGFRSTFHDWASETTTFENIVVEMALNHAIGNKTEAAYRRGDLFDKRQSLMREWEKFATSLCADTA